MLEPIDLSAERTKREPPHEAGWLGCPACGENDWGVVCRFATGAPFVAALVCLGCEAEVSVTNGFLAP
jgi:hypothetical protein